ncbi:MAG: hypothetical protein ABSD49_14550 [Candidatus Bathyarchaeia archaeon]
MSARNLLLSLILAVVISLPFVQADSGPYVIPLEGPRWNSNIIHVHVTSGQDWQQNQTYQAMQVWNQAQLWFAKEYFPNSSVYTFEVGDSSAPVQVTLLNSSTVVGSIQGWTDYHAQNGIMESANVKLCAKNSAEAVLLLSVHELGHVLGIGHVSCCEKDVMNPYPVTDHVSAFPSTLDLYAVHVLAAGFVPTFVRLPNNIPYQTDAPIPTPEFNEYSLIVAICVIGATFCLRRRRSV